MKMSPLHREVLGAMSELDKAEGMMRNAILFRQLFEIVDDEYNTADRVNLYNRFIKWYQDQLNYTILKLLRCWEDSPEYQIW